MKKSSNSYAVIGLGFGDEGKGVTVNSLCHHLKNTLVVRYSGGQQAGHTVTLENGTSHVFSNFGSGSLINVPTYWSKHCTFDPVGFVNELNVICKKGVWPILYVDKRSPITTPYDKYHNQNSSAVDHGTCGAGVGATFAREEKLQSLLVGDLMFPSIFEMKLKLIKEFYKNNPEMDYFLECCQFIMDKRPFVFSDDMPSYDNYVFESSQGLLLDQNTGFFPHVTRSNVGPKNFVDMGFTDSTLFLVTRAFQTRHGNGPMTNEHLPHNILENPNETNVLNRYQGQFKRSLLDLDLIKYGIDKDPHIRNHSRIELVVTCLDLVRNEHRYTIGGKIVQCSDENNFVSGIARHLEIDVVHKVSSPSAIINPFVTKRVVNG